MKQIVKSVMADILIGVILTGLTVAAVYFEWAPTRYLEYKAYDAVSNVRERVSSSPIVIVGIDDESISNMGRWPWPRGYIARMVDFLSKAEAKVIGLNIIYSENDMNQGLSEVRDIIKNIENSAFLYKNIPVNNIYSSLKESEKKLDNDAILSASVGESKRVVLPLVFILGSPITGKVSVIPDYLTNNSIPVSSESGTMATREIIPPVPEFASKALALGHINVIPDGDGTVRSEPLMFFYEGRAYPSFGLQLSLKYLNFDMKDASIGGGVNFGNNSITTSDRGDMLISFSKSFPYFSFYDVASNKVPPLVFKDKVVIIAQSAIGLGPLQVTPIGPNVPSWGIIANVADNIIAGDYIVRPSWAFPLEIGVIVFFGLCLALVIPRLKIRWSALASVLLLALWIGAVAYVLVNYKYWIKLVHPSLLLLIGYTMVVTRGYFFTEEAKERIEADSVETNKMLGLSFQGQGMLDLAFEKFRKCPVEDESVKELLYNLGLDFERKRMFNKAAAVYEHIAQEGDFKDIADRAKKLQAAGDTMMFGLGGTKRDTTLLMEGAETKPTLGRYEITRELGRGAMGVVYLGRDPKINREVAIKTLRYEDVDEVQLAEVKKRFFREAEAAGKLSHPNIVTIYDVGEDYDLAYMAMELLDGSDLTRYCEKEHLLPAGEVLKIISSVAQALDYAHCSGVVHRDIKPANIMVLTNGDVKVTDFGIARVMTSSSTKTGAVMGTPSYMSPEQIVGQHVDGTSDLFSLGVVFYELLTGSKPFAGDNITTLIFNITNSTPVPLKDLAPHIPDNIVSIIERLLAKDKDARFQHGRELASALGL